MDESTHAREALADGNNPSRAREVEEIRHAGQTSPTGLPAVLLSVRALKRTTRIV